MKKVFTDKEYSEISWHDNTLYGVSWRNEYESGVNDLILDIDYIYEWVCGQDGHCSFKVSPADLIFHGITDFKMNIDWGFSGFQCCLDGGPSIIGIERERIKEQKVHLDKPYYKWSIEFSGSPEDANISFGAVGFTQRIRKAPILINRQSLTLNERK